VDLSYHWTDLAGKAVVWDGARTPLGADVAPNTSRSLTAVITTPAQPGTYILQLALVKEGIAWLNPSQPFGFQATPAFNATYGALYSISASSNAVLGEQRTLAVTVTNNGNVPWPAAGPNPINLSYHIFDSRGNVVVWDGARTGIGTDLAPGQSRSINVGYTA